MIRKINENDFESVYKLGNIVNDNFVKLFDLRKISNLDYSNIYVYEKDNKILGFIHIEKMYETVDIINIVVDPKYQHNHIGSELLQCVIDNIKFDRIMLEVNENNTNAINFYKKFKFKEINRRKKYYGESDAIIMEMIK